MDYVDHKYLRLVSVYLTGFKEVSSKLWRFRCPICGDSKKSQNKTRGYLIDVDDGVVFKCHNCSASMGFYSFLAEVAPALVRDYKFEKFENKREQPKIEKKIKEKKKHAVMEHMTPVLCLGIDHPALKYLLSRRIPPKALDDLFYCENVKNLANSVPGYEGRGIPESEAVVIPFRNRRGDLTHLQCRFLGDVKFRFLTFELMETQKIWGHDKLDFNKIVSITEGPFDAMFIDNCVSPGGAGGIQSVIEELKTKAKAGFRIILDKDYETNTQIWKMMRGFIEAGHNVVLFDSDFDCKDINDYMKENKSMNVKTLNELLNSRTFRGLSAKLEFGKIRTPTDVSSRKKNR